VSEILNPCCLSHQYIYNVAVLLSLLPGSGERRGYMWIPIHINCPNTNVADPGYLSRILSFTHPGSLIPDPKTGKKYYTFVMLKKKIWANFTRIIELVTPKIVTKLSKIWIWDPGSGKKLSRIQGSKRHRIPDSQHCRTPVFRNRMVF
jgi:hypothetical protein